MAKKDLKAIVEKGIVDVLEADGEPSDGRLKALALGIKMLAVNAKLEESEFGDYFRPDDPDTGSLPKRQNGAKSPARSRTDGGTDA